MPCPYDCGITFSHRLSRAPRIQKIIRIISACKYGIHDLSRLQAREAGEYYRLNMPFELGIDVGCRLFSKGQRSRKRCLVLEAEHYRYQAAISDISNSDIAVHNGQPEAIVTEVRNWLHSQARLHAPGPSKVQGEFLKFMADNYAALKGRGFSDRDVAELPIGELAQYMERWVTHRQAPAAGRSRRARRA